MGFESTVGAEPVRAGSSGAGEASRGAGASALGAAVQLGLDIDGVLRQLDSLGRVLRELLDAQTRFRVGAAGEQHVAQVLVDLAGTQWSVLPDRRWPGTRRANIDLLLAGPGGVFVIDVKRWADVHLHDGRLWRGDDPADPALDTVAAQAGAVQVLLADEGLAPGEVVPLLVLDRSDLPPTRVGPVHLLGEPFLTRFLLRRAARLSADQLGQIVEALDRGCPPMADAEASTASTHPSARRSTRSSARSPAAGPPGVQEELISIEEAWRIVADAAAAEPVETWMTWLHPTQARLAARGWSGPARIRGAAGTGKTVVALHRARQLAVGGRSVLFTSQVKTLGPVFRSLFTRLTPEHADRATFASVHQVAVGLLRSAGRRVQVDEAGLEECFHRAWSAVHRGSPLADLGVPPAYWRAEIAHVIKGRGIRDPATYAELRRVGRRTALQPTHRTAMWQLYTEYERLRHARNLTDWDDVLLEALAALESGAVAGPWDSVIADEVQDLSCTAIRLLHRLGGDRPDGLLLVGDGQQAIFPGGYTLAEAGVSVIGRSTVLDVNYRNSEVILRHALALVGADPFDDLDAGPVDGSRTVRAARPGGTVVHAEADDPTSQTFALLAHLKRLHAHCVRYGDVAVLVLTNGAARRWRDRLAAGGVPVMLLADYDGRSADAVKVGTFDRAKALEFAHVLIPDSDAVPGPRRHYESDDAYAERRDLERTRLFVGCTRARDGLWLGTTATRGRPVTCPLCSAPRPTQ
ncbi:MAG TPA: UvrD-helicase domain-containing protein [Kineosporiaceae bacterium]